jgi:tetratricopeptide (TPR) repeat protein
MTVTDIASHRVSSWNRQTFQRLKLALSLGLRRQLFVAVCDDLSLRNRLAQQLHAELGATSTPVPSDDQNELKLVSLNLNLNDPNPLAQIAQWLAHNRQPDSLTPNPAFQFLGIERLTRQPAAQRLFLRRLQTIERNLPRLESALLLWLPRPWFYTIQQSVPEFWQWHTGVFEFEGEPTPLPPVGATRPEASRVSPTSEEATGSFKQDLKTLLAQDLGESIDLVTLRKKITGEKEDRNDSQHYQTPQQTPTNHPKESVSKGNQTNTAANSGGVVPYPGPSSYAAPPTEQDALTFQKPTENGIARPYSYQADAPDASTTEAWGRLNADSLGDAALSKLNNAVPLSEELNRQEEALLPSPTSGQATQPTQQSEQQEPSGSSASTVDAYLQLGHHYRQIVEQGDASEENLAIAIQAYEQALQFVEENSPQIPDLLNDIGNLYWMLSRCPTCAEHTLSYLEQSIQAYQLALTRLVAEQAPQTYAMIQNNLGAAYGDLARHKDPAENLEQSIRAYEEALRYRSSDSSPIKYASTQNNLGTAYWNLAQHQSPVENLQAAIAAYTEALCHYHNKSEPLNWAMIQNNLGTAYWNLAQYEQTETWLQLATIAYQDALAYRTPEVAPAACAATQNNLGTAYWHLADRFQDEPRQQQNYLQQCIVAYESAIALAEQLAQKTPAVPVNFDLVATRNNLGLAHYQLATEAQFAIDQGSKSPHLEAALQQHVKACMSVPAQSDAYQTALSYIIKTVRTFYRDGGIAGQNVALSKVPGQLLPEILPRL